MHTHIHSLPLSLSLSLSHTHFFSLSSPHTHTLAPRHGPIYLAMLLQKNWGFQNVTEQESFPFTLQFFP